ncbi:MAG TPA: carboxypeptidase-like regulatory domain-containing protein [Terriglobales bacterium]|nr:carboxypeptidase-like regulatory domain-containing protein [Terriglobales bacterium]
MTVGRKIVIWALVIAALAGALAAVLVAIHKAQPITIKGAVLGQDADPQKQLPIADVQITGTNGSAVSSATSDSSGFFSLTLRRGLRRRQPLTLHFRHPGYQPLDLNEFVSDQIYIARMMPLSHETRAQSDRPEVTVSNVRVRYSVKTTTEADVGSAVKTFQVANVGDVPCKGRHPCSPDGKWKAALSSTSLDAGEGNEFRNARVSCIAGPCPFSRVEFEDLSRGGRKVNVSVRNWSDTTTFLVEAEVVHPMVSDLVRVSYPVIFGRTLNFSLAISAEGPSIEAEINADSIVFPLGPDLYLSWADCHVRIDKDQAKAYRCELKPGYRFK